MGCCCCWRSSPHATLGTTTSAASFPSWTWPTTGGVGVHRREGRGGRGEGLWRSRPQGGEEGEGSGGGRRGGGFGGLGCRAEVGAQKVAEGEEGGAMGGCDPGSCKPSRQRTTSSALSTLVCTSHVQCTASQAWCVASPCRNHCPNQHTEVKPCPDSPEQTCVLFEAGEDLAPGQEVRTERAC